MLNEYCIAGIIAIVWLLMMISGWLSLRWSRKSPEKRIGLRLFLAAASMLVGYYVFSLKPTLSMNDVSYNLGWVFILPMALGIVAFICWVRANPNPRSPDADTTDKKGETEKADGVVDKSTGK